MDLLMKEGIPMSTHLSEFNSISSSWLPLEFDINDEFKATFCALHFARELGYL